MEQAHRSPADPPAAEEVLRALEARLERASEAAERLFAEAADRVKAPPAGWQLPPDEAPPRPSELELLLSILESVRGLVPADLRRRLAEALRELLLAVRALIDWYLERLEHDHQQPVEVEDIPIL
jgi:hypothetical protein